jgi:transcriptional regulator with XRE-family HTH domain
MNNRTNYNRLKIVLAERGRTSRWLAGQMNKNENTISRWCVNKAQPSLAQLDEIARLLGVDARDLIRSTADVEKEEEK